VVMAGGDYYEVFPADDHTLVALIGDASGHGLKACMSIITMHTLVRMMGTARFADTAGFVTEINSMLCSNSIVQSGGGFITLLYVVVDTQAHRVSWTSAGHPPALLLRADGRVEELETTGSLLGLPETTTISDVDGRLGAGDALVLYTDGVIEARRGGELFGEERLRSLLSGLAGSGADRIAGAIQDAAIDFGGSAEDDLAVLVLRQLS